MKDGKTLRDEGTVAVLENSDDTWKEEAHWVIESLVSSGVPFTSEDLRERMIQKPHHPNAIGGFWIHAIKRYDLVTVGYVKAASPKSRAHILPRWVSRKFEGVN